MDEIISFIKRSKLKIDKYEAYMYGYPEIADEILSFLMSGNKRATTSLLEIYQVENAKLPQVGDISIILNSKNEPKCITRITKIEIVEFSKISEEYALIEGEGDKSLSYWKNEHRKVFSRECEEYGIEFNENMRCVCVYFEVIYKE